MTQIVGKAFEERPEYWEGRYAEIIRTIKNFDVLQITFDPEVLKDMSDEQKEKHIEALAYRICLHEWEQNAD
jgi:hypothetical protein